MFSHIINFSIKNKILVFLFVGLIIGYGLYATMKIPIGAVPDITNNQVQIITTSKNLSTQDIEKFITYPVELEMANLPGLEEIRSVSKFGLSVVTLVFNDDMGTYLPRQLIAEKIKSASENIPNQFGSPEMGPITTGLGEIYQYILDVEPAYKNKYSITDLRTIQDWIVKRQLSGIPGVVEVNTWGGYLKQYEVAINTQHLAAKNITIGELQQALEQNNSIAGGSYIEKENQAYFIRGEGLIKSVSDIENIVVKTMNGIPVFVKDLAKVDYGYANRFGGITANGDGEKVLGQVMMLKGESSKKVIDAVKKRVEEIKDVLPEGVYINPFLERSELIGKTMFTISENLILGCLIVVFIVVLLLGNIRSGLIVASVIPLTLLFALSLMYIYGVDANLMSLGAIDFGIIIDGAVIIIEFIAYKITQKQEKILLSSKAEQRTIRDKISLLAGTKMMSSAVFGQLIIIVVFIPILALSGVEGKMFRPMALVFIFALIGAMVLCFTYVPVMASLFLKPSKNSTKNISYRFIKWLENQYAPLINWVLYHKRIVLGIASFFLLISVVIFSRMGGEFVPTLDEGDFVIQPVLKTGTSLSNTIDITTQIEKILKANFPEVKQIVSRIGAAEVPTDPMSMEESDVMITLHPKNTWTSAKSKDELADKFKEALSVIPGLDIEFTQPIEMRFNELITGVRADIAIKIFGDDLSKLANLGSQVKQLIDEVDGAADVILEKTEGLPQMSVQYDRAAIARYGLNIKDLNNILSMGFGGLEVGQIFEGEKKFDLVMRLQKENRKDLNDLKNLLIDLPSGKKIPLKELADISYKKGAAKISRDNTQRRVVVGVNVRNRDLQSVVSDIKRLIGNNINLPIGYRIEYGGQFKNLQSATQRLLISVPIALLLIFIMLYFAFGAIKEAFIIFSAIPFSAIGGIIFLWLRDLPFSISAGIGFIALFGIAVLNGIVLIEHYKELKNKSFNSIEELVIVGTTDRLRAVLLTALAAALGFLPMAISTNAGAEVQRPLATVVIGGLITSTILTLVVLPILYTMFNKKITFTKTTTLIVLALGLGLHTKAQDSPMSLSQLIELANQNNNLIKAQATQVKKSELLAVGGYTFDKTTVYYGRDQNNLAVNNKPLNVIGISQNFKFPAVYTADKKTKKNVLALNETNLGIKKRMLEKELTIFYFELQILRAKEKLHLVLDSLYKDFANKTNRKEKLGEANYLENLTAKSKEKKIQSLLLAIQRNVKVKEEQIKALVQAENDFDIETQAPSILLIDTNTNSNLGSTYYNNQIELIKSQYNEEKKSLLPSINIEAFNGFNDEVTTPGFQIGVTLPLFAKSYLSYRKSFKLNQEVIKYEKQNFERNKQAKYQNLLVKLEQQQTLLTYYDTDGEKLANEILRAANTGYMNGETDVFQFIQSIEAASEIKLDHLNAIENYNQTIIQLNYLIF